MHLSILICLAFGILVSFSPVSRLIRRHSGLSLLCLALGIMAVFTMACAASATLGMITALLPALTSLAQSIVAFVVGLQGKTVSASLAAAITTWSANLGTEVANVQAIIAAATANPTATTIQKLQAAFTAIQSEFGSILAGANITDQSTVSKFMSLGGLFIASIQTIMGIIVALQPAAAKFDAKQISDGDAAAADKHAASLLDHNHKLMKETYSTIVKTKTENEDVNAVLATLKPLP